MSQIKNVVFDNDGVNINSEDIAVGDAVSFIYTLLKNHGGENAKKITYGDIALRIKGHSSDVVLSDIINEFGIEESELCQTYNIPKDEDVVSYLSEQHTLRVIDMFENGQLFVFSGFQETMDKVCDTHSLGLCTASRADRMDATEYALDPETQENAGWANYFPKGNLRFSGHNLPNKYMSFFETNPNFKPEETVCVEDSDSSVKKAIAAGAHSVIGSAYSDFQTLDQDGNFSRDKQLAEIRKLLEAGANIVITDFRDIPTAVEWINAGMSMHSKITSEFKGDVYHNKGQSVSLALGVGDLAPTRMLH